MRGYDEFSAIFLPVFKRQYHCGERGFVKLVIDAIDCCTVSDYISRRIIIPCRYHPLHKNVFRLVVAAEGLEREIAVHIAIPTPIDMEIII